MTSKLQEIAQAMQKVPNPGSSDDRYWLACARAAVEAMREPTKQMLAEGENAIPFDIEVSQDLTPIYAAMISAILNEKP